VIVNDFYALRANISPNEAQTPLAADPHAMLPCSTSAQRFQAIARRRPQVS